MSIFVTGKPLTMLAPTRQSYMVLRQMQHRLCGALNREGSQCVDVSGAGLAPRRVYAAGIGTLPTQ
jgi:hypothetical protein